MLNFIDDHPVLTILLGVVLLFATLVWLFNTIDKANCRAYGEITQRETTFSNFAGCFVRTPQGMVPRNEFDLRAVTNERKGN